MDWTKIFEVKHLNPTQKDERGKVFEYKVDVANAIQQLTFFSRKAGVVCGNHAHMGVDPSKNPEIFILVTGVVDFNFKVLKTDETKTISLNPWDIIIIQPVKDEIIVHTAIVKEDAVWAEPRTTWFDPEHPDTLMASELVKKLQN